MRAFILPSVTLTAALALAACGDRSVRLSKHSESDDQPLRVVTQLECPEHQGSLTRVRTAADGLSCDYVGPKGAEVTLRLIKLASGVSAEDTMKPVEDQLNAMLPGVAAKLAKSDAEAKAGEASASVAEVEAKKAEAVADKARAQADAAEAHADADVSMPGLKVKTRGDKASVHLPGIRVDANDAGAHVNIGGVHIDAEGDKSGKVNIQSGEDSVSIRAQDDAGEVRSRKSGPGLRMSYILFDERTSSDGWRLVGYEARGPKTGPIVAAIVKSRSRHEERLFESAKKLVSRNVGG